MNETKPAKGVNLIVVFNAAHDRVLLCRRRRDPYRGKFNFVGGKIEPGEEGSAAAYRELWEETGISSQDITLTHFMDEVFYTADPCTVEVYVGRLRQDLAVKGEENELFWLPLDENFFDIERFSGEGDMGHILTLIKQQRELLFP